MKLAIKDKGSNLISLNDNQQLLLFQMEVFTANQYLKDLSAKVISGQTRRFKDKKLGFGRVPFGFNKQESKGDLGSTIVPNEDIVLVPKIYEHALKNNVQSAIEILRNSETYRKRSAEPTSAIVKTILRNPIYIGKRTFRVAGVGKHGTIRDNKTNTTYNKNRLKDAALVVDISDIVAPVIEEELFFKVQNILDENSSQWKKGKRKNNQKKKYKYAGLLRCGHCGAKFVAEKKSKHVNYVCPQSKSKMLRCSGGRKTVREEEVKQFIDKWVKDTWNDTGFHIHNYRSALIQYRRFLRQKDGVQESDVAILEGKEKNLSQLMDLALKSSGGINEGLLKKIRQKQDEIDEDRESIEIAKSKTVDFDWLNEIIAKKPEEIIAEYQHSEEDTKSLRLYTALAFAYVSRFETTKTLVEKSTPDVDKKEIDLLFFGAFDDFHQTIKKLVKGVPDLASLAEEAELTFRSDGGRNRCVGATFTQRGILQNIDTHECSRDKD